MSSSVPTQTFLLISAVRGQWAAESAVLQTRPSRPRAGPLAGCGDVSSSVSLSSLREPPTTTKTRQQSLQAVRHTQDVRGREADTYLLQDQLEVIVEHQNFTFNEQQVAWSLSLKFEVIWWPGPTTQTVATLNFYLHHQTHNNTPFITLNIVSVLSTFNI